MTLIVSSGVVSTVGGVSGAIIGAVAGRRGKRLKSADYAEIGAKVSNMGAEMSQKIAADLRKDNEKLENKVDTLTARVERLTDALWIAIRRIESSGQDAADMRAVINGHHKT